MSSATAVLPHHEQAAAAWGLPGANYNEVSFRISDALAHAAQRLNATPGEEILDLGTGTGWSARNVATEGANVTAVDISADLLKAAETLSAHVRPKIAFQLADAEALPFPDGRFDAVISTFGVIFAQNQEQAAAELARVCRKGGRIVLTAWPQTGSVAEFFSVVGKHSGTPALAVSPLAWGDPDHARKLLGRAFDLVFEPGVNRSYFASAEEVWERYLHAFGPVRQVADSLSAEAREALRQDFVALHRKNESVAGVRIDRDYLLILGRRR
jgi:SAM-dependent methyltransferase